MKKQANKINRTKRFFLSIFCLAFIGVTGYSAAQEIMQSRALKAELRSSKKELGILQDEQTRLSLEKDKLTDPAYVENYARGKHLLSKDDEQVFVLPKGK